MRGDRRPDRPEEVALEIGGNLRKQCVDAPSADELGVEAISFTGSQSGIITNARHNRARIVEVRAFRVLDELDAGKVVIVAGYQGVSYGREITTLGRGGSDTTAVALAARLGADACEIYTDVEGIFTADPRVVPDAQLIPTIGYEEMLELAHQGATVMQTRAVELGWVNDVVIRVRSTFSDHPGTSIQEVSAVELRDKVRAMALDRKTPNDLNAFWMPFTPNRQFKANPRMLVGDIVAEGVETHDQYLRLLRMGCRRMQGYFFARPLPAAAVEALFEHGEHEDLERLSELNLQRGELEDELRANQILYKDHTRQLEATRPTHDEALIHAIDVNRQRVKIWGTARTVSGGPT